MTLVDTSAWVEFLRDTGSAASTEVDRLLGSEEDLSITEPVLMEVLAGARDDTHLRDLRGLVGRANIRRCLPEDYETAALLYRTCRQQGETVRRLIDCLIASVALRTRTAVLHHDEDFEVLARHSSLRIHRPR